MDVVVEGGGDFYHDGVVAGMEEVGGVAVGALAVPLHATVHPIDPQLADVVNLAEV